jgi:glycerate kinase
MKVVVAIDSLKDSLTSYEAGKAIEQGIRQACKKTDLHVVVKALADGGEGTVDALVTGMSGKNCVVEVMGPVQQIVSCTYGYLPDSNTAIIEMAGAAGIGLVPVASRNPLYTTTFGVGQVIRQAVEEGIRHFIIGIGGSATNDCGVGMLQALGYRFFDDAGLPVGLGGTVLNNIVSMDASAVLPALADCRFKIACDVNNPLYGPNGAAAVFGPQKGATPAIVAALDDGARHFAAVVAAYYGRDLAKYPGAGAAGGLGFAFLSFLKGELGSGIELIVDAIDLANDLKDADYVVTGEGRLDFQTTMGKAPVGVAKLAKAYGAKVIALAGSTTDDARECNDCGIDAYFSIVNGAMTLQEAMDKDMAKKNMIQTAEQVFRLIFTSERLAASAVALS